MLKFALAGLLCFTMGLAAAPAMSQILPPRDAPEAAERRVTAVEDTLADCQVWLDQLGELLEEANPPVSEEAMREAEQRHERATQACDDGRYDEGIAEAREAIENLEAEAEQ